MLHKVGLDKIIFQMANNILIQIGCWGFWVGVNFAFACILFTLECINTAAIRNANIHKGVLHKCL